MNQHFLRVGGGSGGRVGGCLQSSFIGLSSGANNNDPHHHFRWRALAPLSADHTKFWDAVTGDQIVQFIAHWATFQRLWQHFIAQITLIFCEVDKIFHLSSEITF